MSGSPELRALIESKSAVNSESGCWEWTGANSGTSRRPGRRANRVPYATTRIERRITLAHRVSYEAFKGPIPDGITVDHICFNTLCVNPDHLQLLTRAENAVRRRHILANECRRGHELTPENSIIRPSKPDSRECRRCAADQARARREQRASSEARAARMELNQPPHGTFTTYTNYACRCPECRAAGTEHSRAWRRKRAGAA